MSKAFNDWWNGNELSKDNLHAEDTPAYWAWEGWLAGVKAEREACAKVCEAQENQVVLRYPARLEFDPDSMMARKCAAAIRNRSNT